MQLAWIYGSLELTYFMARWYRASNLRNLRPLVRESLSESSACLVQNAAAGPQKDVKPEHNSPTSRARRSDKYMQTELQNCLVTGLDPFLIQVGLIHDML